MERAIDEAARVLDLRCLGISNSKFMVPPSFVSSVSFGAVEDILLGQCAWIPAKSLRAGMNWKRARAVGALR